MMEAALSGAVAAVISSIGAIYAARAAKNSKPVSNGFTVHVMDELRAIRARLDSHIDSHHNKP